MADASIVNLKLCDFISPLGGGVISRAESSPNHRHILEFPRWVGSSLSNVKLDAAAYCDFILPTTYTNTTGLKAKFNWRAQLPIIAGDVIWEIGFETLTASVDDSTVSDWGTPTVNAASTAPTTAGQVIQVSIAVVKANVGKGGTPVLGEPMRLRIRRKCFTSATDTLLGTVEIIGGVDIIDY